MSMATAVMLLLCSAVRVPQNPSRLLCLRSSATHNTRPQGQVVHQSQIVMALAKRLLIDTDLSDRLRLAPLQPTLHRSLHDPTNFVPAQFQQPGHRFLAGCLEPFNRQRFKQRREPAGGLRQRQSSPRALHARSRRCAAARRAGSYNIGTYPGVATAAVADGREACTPLRIPDTATPSRAGVPAERAPLRPPASTPPSPLAREPRFPGCADTVSQSCIPELSHASLGRPSATHYKPGIPSRIGPRLSQTQCAFIRNSSSE